MFSRSLWLDGVTWFSLAENRIAHVGFAALGEMLRINAALTDLKCVCALAQGCIPHAMATLMPLNALRVRTCARTVNACSLDCSLSNNRSFLHAHATELGLGLKFNSTLRQLRCALAPMVEPSNLPSVAGTAPG